MIHQTPILWLDIAGVAAPDVRPSNPENIMYPAAGYDYEKYGNTLGRCCRSL